MIISTSKVDFNIKILGNINKSIPTIFIHGFMGSTKSWNQIVNFLESPIILIDIPGHGKSKFKETNKYLASDWVNDLLFILNFLNLTLVNICGYSMGGRLGLLFACRYPEKINKLILESSTPGIEDEIKRSKRFKKDKLRLSEIREDFNKFLEEWSLNTLFIKQKIRNIRGWEEQKEIRLSQKIEQLLHALQCLGAGSMPSLWKEIHRLRFPVLILTGSEDTKYCKIAEESTEYFLDCKWVNILDSGHNIHLEQPNKFISEIQNFLFN